MVESLQLAAAAAAAKVRKQTAQENHVAAGRCSSPPPQQAMIQGCQIQEKKQNTQLRVHYPSETKARFKAVGMSEGSRVEF